MSTTPKRRPSSTLPTALFALAAALLVGALGPCAASASSPNVPVPPLTPRIRDYSYTWYALYFLGTAYHLALLWGILASGLAARLRDIAERFFHRRFLAVGLDYLMLAACLIVAQAPLTFFGGFWLDHAYGLSQQTVAGWLTDAATSDAVDIAITLVLLWLLYWLIGRSPRRWSLWLWLVTIPILAFSLFLEPVLIEPLFNHFHPLPPGPLRTQIHALAVRAGIPNAPIFVADASRRTNTANAYVTGLGPTARIVIWDTTIKELPQDEVVGIVGHEMGHYVEKHIVWGFFAGVLALLIALPLGQVVVTWLIRRYGERWRLRGINDIAAVPVFFLTLNAMLFLADPMLNAASRYIEHRADAYGLRVTHNGPAMARAFAFFAQHDLEDPDPPPLIKFWIFDHPPLRERIDFVLGQPQRPGGS